jgi:hypothetical protein
MCKIIKKIVKTFVMGFFNWPNPSSRAMAPGVDSASNKNEYQESSWGKGQPVGA